MSLPPYGYEDDTVIPKERVIQSIKKLEDELYKKPVNTELKYDFWQLRHSAEELGIDYSNAVEKLVAKYWLFIEKPTQERYSELIQTLEDLKRLLLLHQH